MIAFGRIFVALKIYKHSSECCRISKANTELSDQNFFTLYVHCQNNLDCFKQLLH